LTWRSQPSFEDELADVESLATLVDLRKDTKGHEKDYTDHAIKFHINTLLSRGEIEAIDSNAKRIRLLQPLIKARGSMEKQEMDGSKIERLINLRLDALVVSR
jgi:hypothetical protein